MAHSNNWDETVPTNTTNATDIDDHIRKVRLDIRERFGIDHKIASSDDADVAYGIHTKVTLEDAISEPSLDTDESCIYIDDSDVDGEWRFLDKRGIPQMISFVGEVKMRMGTTVPAGWLALNGETIGSGGSGADNAGAEFEELFTFLWNELADQEAPVSTGRGGSAAADWGANETLTMPDSRSRMPIGVGTPQYEKLVYTDGGTHEVVATDTLTGATSGKTCVVMEVILVSGTWAGGDAAGYFVVKDVDGAFQAEDLNEGGNNDVCTIAADTTPFTTRTIGGIGGVEMQDVEDHNHSHNHMWHKGSGGSTANIPGSAGNARSYDSGGSLMQFNRFADMYTDLDATNAGSSSVDTVTPWLVVAFLIKY